MRKVIILHCLRESQWNKCRENIKYGEESIKACGYIHCSSIENFWRVAPNFENIKVPLLLLCIDTNKVKANIKWEDEDNCGREYPHIYGELNLDSVVKVVPLLKNEQGNFILSNEVEQLKSF